MYGSKKCARCGKPATFKFTRIESGSVQDIFLCNEHASETSKYQKPATHLSDILQGLLKQEVGSKAAAGQPAPPTLSCKHCGLPYDAYRKNLMLGCSECYNAFRDYLLTDLRKFHGDTHHVGRRPEGEAENTPDIPQPATGEASHAGNPNPPAVVKPTAPPAVINPQDEIEKLQHRMQIAIAEKDYMKAAQFRDKIKKLRDKIRQEKEQG